MPFSSLVRFGVLGRVDPLSLVLGLFTINVPELVGTANDGVGERSIAHLTLEAQVSTIGRSVEHGVCALQSLSGDAEDDFRLDKPGG
jgi:hypothetical protein